MCRARSEVASRPTLNEVCWYIAKVPALSKSVKTAKQDRIN